MTESKIEGQGQYISCDRRAFYLGKHIIIRIWIYWPIFVMFVERLVVRQFDDDTRREKLF